MSLLLILGESPPSIQFGLGEMLLTNLATIVFIVLFLFFIKKYCKKKPTDVIEKKDEVKKDHEPGDYFSLSDSLFMNLKNRELIIRIITGDGGKYRDKDQITFASSLAYHFDDHKDKKRLLLAVPQLSEVTYPSSHELLVHKSPAAELTKIQDSILKFLFTRLNDDYSWMMNEQSVSMSENNNTILVILSTPTFLHEQLLWALSVVPGVNTADNFKDYIKEKNNYKFWLKKKEAGSWEDIIPQVKEIFISYFKAGVNFLESKI